LKKTGRGKYQTIDALFERYLNKVLVDIKEC
jgi:predicted GTPase